MAVLLLKPSRFPGEVSARIQPVFATSVDPVSAEKRAYQHEKTKSDKPLGSLDPKENNHRYFFDQTEALEGSRYGKQCQTAA
jgi:hypothetical protein